MTFNPAEQGQGQYQQGQPASGPFQQQAGYQPGQAGQAPPWQQGGHQPQGGYQQPRPPAKPSPFASVELSTWLALATSGLGLLTWLLLLFGNGPVSLVPTLGAAVLALFVLLPGEDKAPKVLPFAGGAALLNGLLSISAVADMGFGYGAIGVVTFILVLFQMLAGVGAVLFEYKLVSLPQPAPKPPKPAAAPQQPQQQSWQQSAGQYPQQPPAQQAPQQAQQQGFQPQGFQPQAAQPQTAQPQTAQPWDEQTVQQGFQPQAGQQSAQQGGVGNFDPNLFDSGKFQPVNPQQQGGAPAAGNDPTASGGSSGTKQFSPPETNG